MTSIRWKLIAVFLLVVFIPIYLIQRYAIDFFDQYTRNALEKEMVSYAFIAGEQYKTMILSVSEEEQSGASLIFEDLLAICGPEVQSRIRILSPEGCVLFDSHDETTVGKDFSTRPEVKGALTGRYAARADLTEDRRYLYYYIALPITDDADNLLALSYVSRHTGPIIKAITEMKSRQTRAIILALSVALLTAIILAFTITRRLRRLTRATREFTRGTGPLKLEIKGKDEIGELACSVTRMADEIDLRNRYNRDFLAETMHELKAPLTAIKGAVEVLKEGAVKNPESRDKFISNISYDTERMIRLVGELTRLTQLDIDVLSGKKEEVDYCAFIRDLVARIRTKRGGKSPTFKATIPDTAIRVNILPGRIEQVLDNLLENAFRYTGAEGAVELIVEEDADGSVITIVRDTGRGIVPSNIDKIFDRFFTTEPRDREKPYGSGLGLAIARSIIENHGGTIRVESDPGRGASFTFTLNR
jgi:signal transduction histidine kinase